MKMEEARRRREERMNIRRRNNEIKGQIKRGQEEDERSHKLEMEKLKKEREDDDLKHKQANTKIIRRAKIKGFKMEKGIGNTRRTIQKKRRRK